MEKYLELIENNDELVVVKPLVKTPLDVALNPEFTLDHAYYTITKDEQHLFTTVCKNGDTWDFELKERPFYSLSNGLKKLKSRVLGFIHSKGIYLELQGKPTRVSAQKESRNGPYTIIIEGERDTYETVQAPKTIQSEDDAIKWAKKTFNIK